MQRGKKMTHNQENRKSTEIFSQMTRMLQLSDKNIKITAINNVKKFSGDMDTVGKQRGNFIS